MSELDILLNWHLASDELAVVHLPLTLSSLQPDCLCDSPALSKWVSRVNSLLRSKLPGPRWAGLCLAHKSASCNQQLIVEQAQSWLSLVIASLLKDEPWPNRVAGIRLLLFIYESTLALPEFQRQVVLPTAPKFSHALLSLIESKVSSKVKDTLYHALSSMILNYPSSHRPLLPQLTSHCERKLASVQSAREATILSDFIRMHALLPIIAGKVGFAAQWRACLEQALEAARSSYQNLRTTYRSNNTQLSNGSKYSHSDAMVAISSSLSQLKLHLSSLFALLRSHGTRPVAVPFGKLASFALQLLQSSAGEVTTSNVDVNIRAMESAAAPELWKAGCDLSASLFDCGRQHCTPYARRVAGVLITLLEGPASPSLKLVFLKTICKALDDCHPAHEPLLSARIARSILPTLKALLPIKSETKVTQTQNGYEKKRKKKAGDFDGDKFFKTGKDVICKTNAEGELLLSSVQVLRSVSVNPSLPPELRSLVCRVLLNILFNLSNLPASSLSANIQLHGRLLSAVKTSCQETFFATAGFQAGAIDLVIGGAIKSYDSLHAQGDAGFDRPIECLIHPRLPPLHEAAALSRVSLFLEDENVAERQTLKQLGLASSLVSQDKSSTTPSQQTLPSPESRVTQRILLEPPQELLAFSAVEPLAKQKSAAAAPDAVMAEMAPDHGYADDSRAQQSSSNTDQGHRVPKDSDIAERGQMDSLPIDPVESEKQREVITQLLLASDLDEEDEEPIPSINMDSSDEEEE